MNAKGYYYEVLYRLDDINDYDNTEYSGELNTKKEARAYAFNIISYSYKSIFIFPFVSIPPNASCPSSMYFNVW